MRFRVDFDRIERNFTNFTDLWPDTRSIRLRRMMFPPGQTLLRGPNKNARIARFSSGIGPGSLFLLGPLTEAVDMKAMLRRAFIFFLSITIYFAVFIFLFLTAIVVTILYQYRHHIHHFHWRLLKLLYGIALDIFFGRYPPMQYVTGILVFSAFGFAWLFALRWAWNRRAKRLNYEASQPQPSHAIDTGVWPPPPIASIATDALPKK